MKTTIMFALSAVLALGATAQQDVETPHVEHHDAEEPLGRPAPDWEDNGEGPLAVGEGRGMMCPCPMCNMGRGRGPGRGMEMRLREAGVPEETIARARMLMRARIHPADPQGLLALQGELNLRRAQVDELRDIIENTQEQALDVLTDEQWERLRQLRPRAESMMEIHRTLMPHMRNMRDGGMMPERGPMRDRAPMRDGAPMRDRMMPDDGPMRDRAPMRDRMMRRRMMPERQEPLEE